MSNEIEEIESLESALDWDSLSNEMTEIENIESALRKDVEIDATAESKIECASLLIVDYDACALSLRLRARRSFLLTAFVGSNVLKFFSMFSNAFESKHFS